MTKRLIIIVVIALSLTTLSALSWARTAIDVKTEAYNYVNAGPYVKSGDLSGLISHVSTKYGKVTQKNAKWAEWLLKADSPPNKCVHIKYFRSSSTAKYLNGGVTVARCDGSQVRHLSAK